MTNLKTQMHIWKKARVKSLKWKTAMKHQQGKDKGKGLSNDPCNDDSDLWQRMCSSAPNFNCKINLFKLCDWLKGYFSDFYTKKPNKIQILSVFYEYYIVPIVPKIFEGFVCGEAVL